jgi:anti-sigma B factor antagonist
VAPSLTRPRSEGCDVPDIVRHVSSDFADIMDLQVTEHGSDARIVTVLGEVDALTAPELAAFLTAQLAAAQVVVVDLDGVGFLGSAGLSVLFEANEQASRQDRVLRLVCNSRIANRALEATELKEHFSFADNVPDALKDPP